MNARGDDARGQGVSSFLLNVQAALVCVGFLLNLIILIADIVGGVGVVAIVALFATLVAFSAIGTYCLVGYRAAEARPFLVAVYGVAIMLFAKALVPATSVFDTAILMLGFGLSLVFAERIDRPASAQIIMVGLVGILSIGAIVAMVRPFAGEAPTFVNVLARLIPWTHAILAGTIALAYSSERQDIAAAARGRRG